MSAPRPPLHRSPWIVAATIAALALLAWGSYAARRASIRTFFVDGVPTAKNVLTPDGGTGVSSVARTRVLLIDGLSRSHALTLAALDHACAGGIELAVDTGFPTVSLPVQHALWTGLTQQESGVQYRIGRIDPPPPDSIALAVPDSVAVAESHRDIVHSFGFASALPSIEDDTIEAPDSAWRREGFVAAAIESVQSNAALVFVHVLRVDEAGHAKGGASPEYAQAATDADGMLASLLAAAPADERTRWFVLADHGHLPGGGHGDAEDAIRIVRACVLGGGLEPARHEATIHLVDLHRAVVESLGLSRRSDAGGRTLAGALADPQPSASLPRARTFDVVIACMVMLVALIATWWCVGTTVGLAVLWPVVATASVLLLHGSITLSNPVVYPPFGRDVLIAATPGFGVLAFSLVLRSGEPLGVRALVGWMLPIFGAWVATGWACRVPHALLGGPPPLVPTITAYHSVTATLLAGGFVSAAIAVLAIVLVRRR